MLIKSFSCSRFAGLKEINVQFEKGLNVILGPNESGKSTLVEGIYATLFKEPRLRMSVKSDREFHERFMPHPDGDVIDGEITICIGDKEYRLKKEWGVTESLQLVTPDGTIIKNAQTANDILKEILKFGSGTYSSIVFAKQRDIKEAIEQILSDETSSEVSNILMKTMMELDGISVDELDKRIQNEKDILLKRWDLDKNCPVNNRGINNPYKTGLGEVLESYYRKERIRLSMNWAQEAERDFEEICDELKVKSKQILDLKSKKDELEKIEDDVTKRLVSEPKIERLEKDSDTLSQVCKEWPIKEALIEQLDNELKTIFPKIRDLEKEKENLRKAEKKSEITNKLANIDELNKKIDDTRIKIKQTKNITDDDIAELENIHKEISKIEAAMKAGVIIGKFNKINTPCDILLTTDLKSKQKIKQGETFTANGYVKIESDEFELELKTGELDYEKLKGAYVDNELKLKELLNNLQLENIEEAKLNKETLKRLKNEENNLKEQVALLLGDKKYDDLKAELKQLEDLGQARNIEEINGEMEELSNKQMECKINKKSAEKTLQEWTKEYESLDKAFDLLVEKKMELKEIKNELDKLAPIPEEFESAEDFKNSLSHIRDSYEKVQQEYSNLKEDYYEYQKSLPESTYEELKAAYTKAESIYDKKLKRAQKLVKIHEAFEKTKEEIGKTPFKPLADKFTEYLCMLTDGNYNQGQIDESFDISLQNKNGVTMPPALLSAGTHDCVALALRFSILKYIYGNTHGYVILDDCIVDLDPERKKMAVQLIKQYAEKNQVIFTTCNPEIAELLGGNIITM
ncbi:MAG TPA: AAA family ATPase [Thermoanaerobacterales bacterium]|jgi:exonuclease SbcC|nr:AAA family ATPase [Thermoanaerobacterales bacterium]